MALWRRSSWAIGHSATMAGGPIGTRPWRPTTSVTIDVGSTSTSSSHGSRSSVSASISGDHRVDEPARQPSTDAGDEPHGRPGGRARGGDRRRPDRHDRPLWIRRQRLDQHHIGAPAGDPGGARVDRLVVDVVPLEPAHERRGVVADVHRQHTDIAAPDQPLADHVGRADRHDRGVVGQRRAQLGARRSLRISSASSHTASNGSADVVTLAHSHHSGPTNGCRSTMRRHATTRPDGSTRSEPSAWAVSSASDAGSAPWARAT